MFCGGTWGRVSTERKSNLAQEKVERDNQSKGRIVGQSVDSIELSDWDTDSKARVVFKESGRRWKGGRRRYLLTILCHCHGGLSNTSPGLKTTNSRGRCSLSRAIFSFPFQKFTTPPFRGHRYGEYSGIRNSHLFFPTT